MVGLMKYTTILLLLIAGYCAGEPYRPQDVAFKRLFDRDESVQTQVGLVSAIAQDAQGFMWFGGSTGLARYDSNDLRFFKKEDGSRLPSNSINTIALDPDGHLWVGTASGLVRHDPKLNIFIEFENLFGAPLPSRNVTSIQFDSQRMYIGTTEGLLVYNPRTSISLLLDIKAGLPSNDVSKVFLDSSGTLWIALRSGGVAILPAGASSIHILDIPCGTRTTAINETRDGLIWLGTFGDGVCSFDIKTTEITRYAYSANMPDAISSNTVWDILPQGDKIYFSTDHGGLSIFNRKTESFSNYISDPTDKDTISGNTLRSLFSDRNGDIWIGVFPGQIDFLDLSKTKVKTFYNHPYKSNTLSNSAITSLASISGNLWVGTEKGLNRIGPNQNITQYFPDRTILDIEPSVTPGSVWVGTWSSGLMLIDANNMRESKHGLHLNDRFVWAIAESTTDLFVGTENGGLNKFNLSTSEATYYKHDDNDPGSISHNFVRSILFASDDSLLVGTKAGLDVFDILNNRFDSIPLLQDTNSEQVSVLSIHKCSEGLIWVGTMNFGIFILDADYNVLSVITESEGLSANTVSGFYSDDGNYIWAATTNGISRIERESLSIDYVRKKDGLAGNFANRNAIALFNDNLWVGTSRGLSTFSTSFSRSISSGELYLTDLLILNRPPKIGEGMNSRYSVGHSKKIVLDHDDSMVRIDFSLLDYRNAGHHNYSYMLEGFDRHWVESGSSNEATYTNLPSGKYTFYARANVNSGERAITSRPLKIIVLRPPWLSSWAIAFYVILLAGAIYTYRYVRGALTKSQIDPLTGLHNRNGVSKYVQRTFKSFPNNCCYSLMVIDIDHFKMINDTYGHDSGDRVIKCVARIIKSKFRKIDMVARWGGEEFIVLTSATTFEASRFMAERVRLAIEQEIIAVHRLIHNDQGELDTEEEMINITVSVGFTNITPGDSFDDAFKRADDSLYTAKQEGRNRVRCISRHLTG